MRRVLSVWRCLNVTVRSLGKKKYESASNRKFMEQNYIADPEPINSGTEIMKPLNAERYEKLEGMKITKRFEKDTFEIETIKAAMRIH